MARSRPCSNGEQPKFCTVIIDPEADNLRIPQEFVRSHGHDLPGNVFLKVPSGKLWKVEVIKVDGEIFLTKGWEKFKEQYFVQLGDFLVFKYDGDSRLDVFIFDMTCTQIEYPSSDDDSDEETGSESNGSIVFLGEICKSQKGKEKTDDISESSASGQNLDEGCSYIKYVPKKKRGEAYKKAAAFKATIPRVITSFITVMDRSNTSHQYCLSIPVSIARNFFSRGFNRITLHVIGGGTYYARCSLNETKARITSGWKEVVLENKIKAGECCVIRVNRKDKLAWYVNIFRS